MRDRMRSAAAVVRSQRVWLALLLVVTVAGGGLRAQAAAAPSAYQSVDERAYARLARNLARHGEYGDRTMRLPVHWAPGAPAVFAVAHELRTRYPSDPDRWDVPSAYPVQAAAGTATIPGVYVLGALVLGPAAGLAGAAAIAFYPPAIDAAGDLLSEPLGALVLVWALVAVLLALRRPTVARALLAGVLLGATVLVRADLLAAPFVLALLLGVAAWRSAGRLRGLAVGGAALAGVLACLAPWSAYASGQTGRFTPVSAGGASNLFVGTYLPGDGTMFGLKRALADEVRRMDPSERGTKYFNIPQRKVIEAVVAGRPEPDRESALRAAALENLERYALGQPGAFAGMLAAKADRLWLGYSVGTHGNMRTGTLALHLAMVALAALALLGAPWWARGRLWMVAALAVPLAWTTAINLVLVSEPRHNLPVMPVVAVLAGAGVVAAGRQLGPALIAATRPGATLLRRS